MGEATVPVVGHIQIMLLANGQVQVGGSVPNLFALKGMLGCAEETFREELRKVSEKPKLAPVPPGIDFHKLRNGG